MIPRYPFSLVPRADRVYILCLWNRAWLYVIVSLYRYEVTRIESGGEKRSYSEHVVNHRGYIDLWFIAKGWSTRLAQFQPKEKNQWKKEMKKYRMNVVERTEKSFLSLHFLEQLFYDLVQRCGALKICPAPKNHWTRYAVFTKKKNNSSSVYIVLTELKIQTEFLPRFQYQPTKFHSTTKL